MEQKGSTSYEMMYKLESVVYEMHRRNTNQTSIRHCFSSSK